MNILITGISSKLGTPLVKRLAKAHNIYAITRNPAKLNNSFSDVTYIEQDLLERLELDIPIDAIIHLAAYVPYNTDDNSADNFQNAFLDNLHTTANLLTFALEHQVKKIIFASSIDVYGSPVSDIVDEDTNCAPNNYYGLSKIACEDLMNVYFHNYGLQYSCFRIGYVLAEGMGEERFLHTLLTSIKKGEPVLLYNPDNILNIIHADEVAETLVRALTGPTGTFNLSKPVSLDKFTQTAINVFRSSSKVSYTINGKENRHIYANTKLLKYYGDIFQTLEETIRKTMGS